MLFVTHDSREAVQLAQRIIVLSGSPASVAQDRRISLTAEERRDAAKVEALREELRAETATKVDKCQARTKG